MQGAKTANPSEENRSGVVSPQRPTEGGGDSSASMRLWSDEIFRISHICTHTNGGAVMMPIQICPTMTCHPGHRMCHKELIAPTPVHSPDEATTPMRTT